MDVVVSWFGPVLLHLGLDIFIHFSIFDGSMNSELYQRILKVHKVNLRECGSCSKTMINKEWLKKNKIDFLFFLNGQVKVLITQKCCASSSCEETNQHLRVEAVLNAGMGYTVIPPN